MKSAPCHDEYLRHKFLYQIMYGHHLFDASDICATKDQTVIEITLDCIDQCLCNTVRHLRRIAVLQPVSFG